MSTDRAVDPAISRLSLELLHEIFELCLPDKRSPNVNTAPLQLCRICSSWRAAAFGLPKLWDTLILHFPNEVSNYPQVENTIYASELAHFWFSNAGNSMLSLSLHWYGGLGVEILDNLVVSYSNRFYRLNLLLTADSDFPRFFALPPGHIENLEYLSLRLRNSMSLELVDMPVFQSAPHLRRVLSDRWCNSHSPRRIALPWTQLTHLDIRQCLPDRTWRTLFVQCPLLERCVVNVDFGLNFIPKTTQTTLIELPNLVELTVRVYRSVLGARSGWFYDFSFPSLKELKIHSLDISPARVDALGATLPFSSLQRLAIMRASDPGYMVALLRTTTSLTELSLALSISGTGPGDVYFWNMLGEVSACALPQLEVLELWLSCDECTSAMLRKCADAIKSRWCYDEGLGAEAVARLQCVMLHFVNGEHTGAEEMGVLLGGYGLEGLKISIDTSRPRPDRSKEWWDI